jgi:outer membrane protein TolC
MTRLLRLLLACSVFVWAMRPAVAQISLSTAVNLALKNSPKVRMAQADVDKSLAALQEVRDVYVPTVVFSSGLGPPSYGFPLGNPSIFSVTSQSLVFSYSQRDYIRSARAALDAANLTLTDARQAVAEDTALTFVALDRDIRRQAALNDEAGFSSRLIGIVQERLDAGQDTTINLTIARLTDAQIRLSRLRADDETSFDQNHLAQLIGLPAQGLSIFSNSIPALAPPQPDLPNLPQHSSPAVESAYAAARSKRELAFGDARYIFRPQITFAGQYQRFAEFNNYQNYYLHFQQNNAAVGVQISIPLFDTGHRAKARESAADAAHSEREADITRDQFFESRLRAQHSMAELAVRAEVAGLDQQLAQQQLDILLIQLKAGTGNSSGTQMSPKDEQTSRIAERDKFLSVLDANFQMRQAQITLLRQTGGLDAWLRLAARSSATSTDSLSVSKP